MVDEDDNKRGMTGPWITVGTALAGVALVAYIVAIRTPAAAWAAALFALSVVLDLGVLRKQIPDSRIASDLAMYEIVKFGLLLFYALFETGTLASRSLARCLAYLALALALWITYAMVIAAARMIRDASTEGSSTSRSSIAELLSNNKVLGLTALVIAFLHVSYCLTFALAFSDRFGQQHDLYATWDGVLDRPKKPVAPQDAPDAPLCPTPIETLGRVRKIFFVESAATLRCTQDLRDAARRSNELRARLCENGIESRIDAFKNVTGTSCDASTTPLERRAAVWNLSEIYALRSLFRQLAVENAGCTYQIEIRGHANDTRLNTEAYGSNYEISKQRADQVENLIAEVFEDATRGLDAPAVRWLTYGVSNEPSFLEPGVPPDAKPLEALLSVELQVQKVGDSFGDHRLRAAQSDRRDLELLDYLYFTVYTITTTGYGDITPTSAYAKAVVTIANLIELLFVVVLVNVIANTRPRPGKGAEDARRPA